MKAYYLDELNPKKTEVFLDRTALQKFGIVTDYFDPQKNYLDQVNQWLNEFNYSSFDEVKLTPQTPKINEINQNFFREHHHTDDEVRYLLDGSGIFDIRNQNDQWLRIEVTTGDFLIIPANRYHRFCLTKEMKVHAVRLFKENPKWEAIFRE